MRMHWLRLMIPAVYSELQQKMMRMQKEQVEKMQKEYGHAMNGFPYTVVSEGCL